MRNGGAGIGRIVLCTDAAVCEDADSGRDDEGSSGSRERRADGLDREPVRLAGGREVREVVNERGVDDAIRCSRAAFQAVVIVESTPMRLGTGRGEQPRGRIRASQAEHLMARADELLHDGRANESCGAGDEDTHDSCPPFSFSFCVREAGLRPAEPGRPRAS